MQEKKIRCGSASSAGSAQPRRNFLDACAASEVRSETDYKMTRVNYLPLSLCVSKTPLVVCVDFPHNSRKELQKGVQTEHYIDRDYKGRIG